MDKSQILKKLESVVIDGTVDEAKALAEVVISNQIDPLEAIENGLSKGMAIVGSQFETGEVFLPELLMAARHFNAAMVVLKPAIAAQNKTVKKFGKVLISTVKGDVHTIGKDIVASVLDTSGFEVVDIGVDNPSLKIIEEAEKIAADVIALSSLMTTTMPAQKEVIDTLIEMGLRQKYIVIVGGGPVNQEWADRIGAEGYGKSAINAVGLAKELIAKRA